VKEKHTAQIAGFGTDWTVNRRQSGPGLQTDAGCEQRGS
jgi:hypothetical protein